MNSKKTSINFGELDSKKKIPYSLEIHIEVEGEMMLHMNSSQKKKKFKKKEDTRGNKIKPHFFFSTGQLAYGEFIVLSFFQVWDRFEIFYCK